MAEDLILCPACLERIVPLDADRCECGECPICAGYMDGCVDEKPTDHQHTSDERAYVRQLYWVAPARVEEVRAGIRRSKNPLRRSVATAVSLVGMTLAIFGITGLCFLAFAGGCIRGVARADFVDAWCTCSWTHRLLTSLQPHRSKPHRRRTNFEADRLFSMVDLASVPGGGVEGGAGVDGGRALNRFQDRLFTRSQVNRFSDVTTDTGMTAIQIADGDVDQFDGQFIKRGAGESMSPQADGHP